MIHTNTKDIRNSYTSQEKSMFLMVVLKMVVFLDVFIYNNFSEYMIIYPKAFFILLCNILSLINEEQIR